MRHRSIGIYPLVAMAVSLSFSSQPTFAESDRVMEEVVTTGTRSSKERSVSDAPVPIDIISADDFNALGGSADLTDNLRALVPSYTATPATGDGSAFVRPTSLRGLAPDQTLVLVNGKRRHRSALVQFFAPAAGNGAHGVDVGMIPGISLKRVEVLRDGAAAQYGSDAIAGVINFVTKDADEGGSLQIQFGQHYEEEENYKISANGGFRVGSNGFINLSAELFDNDGLSRGIIRPDAQALIDAGVPDVGLDAPFGDTPFTQTWGRPESNGKRFFLNSGFELNDNLQLYVFGNFGEVDGRYRFFYRDPSHSTIAALNALGFTGLQAGYTPFLDGDQSDISIVAGIDGELSSGTYDVSIGFGRSELDYVLNNTLNPSIGLGVNGLPLQRNFDVGGYEQEEVNINIDFSRPIGDNLNLAYGAEWREETYTINVGEFNSYTGSGSNGLNGFAPQDAGEFDRDNFALYVDIEHDVSDAFLVQYALRYEDFSDFGGTTNGKIAYRYRVSETFAFRGAISTGFHAPTPGQSNVRTTITTFDGVTGLQVEEGLVQPTSPQALAVGGTALKEEESLNFSSGFSADFGENTTLTFDVYQIEVDDKIYRTRDIAVAGSTTGATISFYTNALDIESKGIDLVLTSGFEWGGSGVSTDLTFAFSYNKVEVTGQGVVAGIIPVADSIVEDIENNYPNERFVLTTNTFFNDKWNFMARANFYGEHFDERGTINAATDPSAEIDSTIYVDVELGYQMTENVKLILGAVNVFDEFIDKIGVGNANRLSVGLQYPRRSAANYEGGSYYLRAIVDF